ncbi:MAG: DinB family protein [Cytophagales bacterium]|nr:DinB family protein [Cytophagales bacterium]
METKQLIESWKIHNRINLYLLTSIRDEHLADLSASKGRNVGEQFAHMHNVRLMWLKAADPELLQGLSKIDKDARISKKLLTEILTQSSKAIISLFVKVFEQGKVKGFEPHPAAFFTYLISHESHQPRADYISAKAVRTSG